MRYYKIITGYQLEEYVQIDETELEKAIYCYLEKKDAVYSGGAVRGSRIVEIKPDYHRAMGWNRGYELQRVDYEELKNKGLDRDHHHTFSLTKEKVQYLMQSGQTNLIGKNVEVIGFERKPELPRGNGGMKSVGELATGK